MPGRVSKARPLLHVRVMFGLDARTARVLWTATVFGAAVAAVYLLRGVLLLLIAAAVFAHVVYPWCG